MAPIAPADRVCISCQTEDGKYKCPRCMKYTKKHKEEHPAEEDKPKPTPADSATGDSSSSGEQQPDEFNKLFAKYPALASYLNQIADSTEPPSNDPEGGDNGDAGGGGGGSKFSSHPRKKPRHNKPWTREVGLQNGLHKLRQLRDQDTTGALKEFGELVLMINAQKAQEEARKVEAQRDAELIGQLIREERD
ncbi:hypothetical protein PFICI_08907 [Pestalotiopsis fici W106-1]|uniref:HIT-type domain-containing protein n=1 Tax=Pestalotiopsis fici (strain W106-1 / CGMCC3.15140) TaxID=1229662 RepID=W3WZ45_PESFW|nr:uncharacterized protein PFICI_08907 [Pestalotiopsis fici W106-1]ETS79054.1 hypothetical protein PFICI_08907 [Pestalotiopsis fici W106-1]